MKSLHLYLFTAALLFAVQGKADTFNVTTPGTLEQIIEDYMADAEDLNVYELKVTGKINGKDIAFIRSKSGYVTNLQVIDLSEVELVPSDDYYYVVEHGSSGDYYYYDVENHDDGLKYNNVYRNDLSYAFSGMDKIKEIKLPKSLPALGEYIFSECDSLKTVELPNGITEIKTGAFNSCKKLDITLPNTLKKVGAWAFYFCSSMTSELDLSNVEEIGEYSFSKCQLMGLKLSPYIKEIPEGAFKGYYGNTPSNRIYNNFITLDLSECKALKSIGRDAFKDNKKLTNLILPDGLETIENEAFYLCGNLSDVYMPLSVRYIGTNVFSKSAYKDKLPRNNGFISINRCIIGYEGDLNEITELTVPDGMISIPSVFSGKATTITKVTLPESMQTIGNFCFSNFTGLTELVIPDSVTFIGEGAFSNCMGLTKLTLSKRLKTLESESFVGCTGLTQVTIPESVEIISSDAFSGCTGLVRVTWNAINCVTNGAYYHFPSTIKQFRFGDKVEVIPACLLYGLENVTSVTLPQSLKKIGEYAFSYTGITSIDFPASLETIGEEAFSNSSLCSMTFPQNSSLKCIGESAFKSSKIYLLVLPESLDSIYQEAFEFCDSLTEITIPTNLKYLGGHSFYDCNNLATVYYNAINTEIGHREKPNGLYPSVSYLSLAPFYKCNLKKFVIGNKVEKFAIELINSEQKNISEVVFEEPSSLKYLDDSFAYSPWRKSLPVGVTYAGKVAVAYNATSTSSAKSTRAATQSPDVEIADGTVCIAGGFAYGQKIASISIPNSVETIGYDAFFGATFTSLHLAENTSEINREAFFNCSELTDLYCPAKKPANIIDADTIMTSGTFKGITPSNITLHVYPESEAAYRSATGWKDFNIVADLEITTDIANAASEGFGYAISATDNGIVVSGTDAQVSVYGVDGQRVYCGKAGRIDVTPGLYIVRVGEKSQKVVVR